jgi:hypothetical protein
LKAKEREKLEKFECRISYKGQLSKCYTHREIDIEIKDGQVCVNIDDILDESESDISQQDDNNRDDGTTIRDFNNENNNNNCNDESTPCINQGTGDNMAVC